MDEHGQVYFFADLEKESANDAKIKRLLADRQRYADEVAKTLDDKFRDGERKALQEAIHDAESR